MTQLRIAEGLTLPLEAVTEKLAFLGRTGGGKTYAAMKLAEEMHRAGAQFIVLDPVGKWWGLRLAADGKAPGLAIPVFGGLHGDVPLEPTAGKLVADLIADRAISVVLDVSQFESDAAKARFASDFADRFFFRKKSQPSACHLFLEEAQEFVPQNPQREEATMLHRFTRYVKLGRNFGLGCSLISQRPQEVNKKVLNQTELLFAFQMTGPQERKTVEGWIAEKGIDEDIAGELPKLKQGAPHVWSPAWLSVSKVVKILPKRTFDASSTPKVGARAVESQALAPIDLERIRKDMAATIEKAKQEDPRELRLRIQELERAARSQKPAPSAAPVTKIEKVVERKEVPVLKDGQLARLEKVVEKLGQFGERTVEIGQTVVTVGKEITAALARLNQPTNGHSQPARARLTRIESMQTGRVTRPTPARQVQPPRLERPAEGEFDLTGPRQRILNALAWLESIGIERPSKTQLALWSDASPTSSAYANNLGALRVAGLIAYGSGSTAALTPAGRAIANPPDHAPSIEEVHDSLLSRLTGPQAKIMRVLIASYPTSLGKEDLAEQVDASPTSSAYANNLGTLRTLGVIDYPEKGTAVALPVLFLEGV